MTGQQKVEKKCTLQTHFTLNKKGKKKGTLMRKTGSNNHQREQKASKKITSIRRPHSWIKDDVKIRQMTCHNPFKKKNTQRKEEKSLRIHYRHFKNGPLIFLPHPKLSNQSTNKFENINSMYSRKT